MRDLRSPRFLFKQKHAYILQRKRLAGKEALRLVTVVVSQEFKLFSCFNAFRNHLDFQPMCERNDGLRNDHIVGIAIAIATQRLIDLESVDRKKLKIGGD